MSERIFDWQEQLEVGDVGEKDFLKFYKKLEPRKSKDLTVDFWLKHGLSVELKTDTYDMNKTPNFFMELYGNEQKKLGGPWRAKKDCVNLFVYYFKTNRTFFWFDPITLCDRIDQIVKTKNLNTVKIVNDGWAADGYKIPRDDVQCVCMRKETF